MALTLYAKLGREYHCYFGRALLFTTPAVSVLVHKPSRRVVAHGTDELVKEFLNLQRFGEAIRLNSVEINFGHDWTALPVNRCLYVPGFAWSLYNRLLDIPEEDRLMISKGVHN